MTTQVMAIVAHTTTTMANEEPVNVKGDLLKETFNEHHNLTRLRPQAYRSDTKAANSIADTACAATAQEPGTVPAAASRSGRTNWCCCARFGFCAAQCGAAPHCHAPHVWAS